MWKGFCHENKDKLRNIPGPVILTGGILTRFKNKGSCLRAIGIHDHPVAHIRLGNWLEVYLITRNSRDNSVYRDVNGVTVLFDGYLSDIYGLNFRGPLLKKPARIIAGLYGEGNDFLMAMRGSYTCVIIDEHRGRVLLFSDRRGSRPLFYRQEGPGSIIIAPEVRNLALEPSSSLTLDRGAFVEFLLRGSFCWDRTLFSEIRKFTQAARAVIHEKDVTIDRFWRIKFKDPPEDRSDGSFVEECDELLTQATGRLMRILDKPFLTLSGGVDSRLVLAYFLKEGASDTDLVTYSDPYNTGDDAVIASEIANELGLPIRNISIRFSDIYKKIKDTVLALDCRIEIVDALPLFYIWDGLHGKYNTIVNGHICFIVDRKPVQSIEDALDNSTIMFYRLRQAPRLADWLKPEVLGEVESSINESIWRARSIDEPIPKNLKDVLYYEQRMGNYLNGFTGAKLRVFEQARPLLDEDLIEFMTRLPLRLRYDKLIIRKTLDQKMTGLNKIPFSKRCFLPTSEIYLKLLQTDEILKQYFHDELTVHLDPRIRDILNIEKFNESLSALLDGTALPFIYSNWIQRVPGMWRFFKNSKDHRVFPVFLLIRLFQINVYLRGMGA